MNVPEIRLGDTWELTEELERGLYMRDGVFGQGDIKFSAGTLIEVLELLTTNDLGVDIQAVLVKVLSAETGSPEILFQIMPERLPECAKLVSASVR